MARPLGTGDLEEFRRAGHELVDAVADHLEELPERPVWQPLPDDLRAELLALPLPAGPSGLGPLAGTMARDVLPFAMGNGHPAFFGWVNSPPSLAGVLASLTAAAMNPSVVSGDHADVHLERTVVRWLAELVGYPARAGRWPADQRGFRRDDRLPGRGPWPRRRRGWARRAPGRARGRRRLCLLRAVRGAQLRDARHRAARARQRVDPARADFGRAPRRGRAARRDRGRPRGGRTPALLVGSAGTVNTGAIDPLEALADVAAAEGLWFHVDGAYGAFGVLDPALATRYRGMERADSLTLDPHKWLGVPVDSGCALVRSADDLREAFSTVPPYLRQDAGTEVGTFAEHGFEQTRPFRALKTWATIAARGRDGIVDQVVRANALARELAALVEGEPRWSSRQPPETSIVAFRARPPGCAPDRLEAVNRALPEAVQARGRAFVTGTVYEGRETMRACILHPGTTAADLATLVAEVIAAAGDLAAAPS